MFNFGPQSVEHLQYPQYIRPEWNSVATGYSTTDCTLKDVQRPDQRGYVGAFESLLWNETEWKKTWSSICAPLKYMTASRCQINYTFTILLFIMAKSYSSWPPQQSEDRATVPYTADRLLLLYSLFSFFPTFFFSFCSYEVLCEREN